MVHKIHWNLKENNSSYADDSLMAFGIALRHCFCETSLVQKHEEARSRTRQGFKQTSMPRKYLQQKCAPNVQYSNNNNNNNKTSLFRNGGSTKKLLGLG